MNIGDIAEIVEKSVDIYSSKFTQCYRNQRKTLCEHMGIYPQDISAFRRAMIKLADRLFQRDDNLLQDDKLICALMKGSGDITFKILKEGQVNQDDLILRFQKYERAYIVVYRI